MGAKVWQVGLVGAGEVAAMHLDGIARHPDRLTLAAVVDPEAGRRRAAADGYAIPRRYARLEEMLSDGDVDVAVVCTPTPIRLAVLEPLLRAGIPVFCEKPLAETYAQAAEIATLAAATGVPLAVDQNFRRFFTFHLAREVLASGEVGRPLHLVQVASGLWSGDTTWRVERNRYTMAVMSIHWFDGYRYLLGEEPETVYCRGVNSPAVEGGPDTAVSVILEFPGGAVVNLSESFSAFSRVNSATLDGERGGLLLDYETLTVVDPEGNRREIANPFDKPEATVHLLLDLCDAVEAGREPETSARDNLNSMRILEAAYRSLAEGAPIEVGRVA